MNKTVALSFSAILALGVLAGCGAENKPAPADDPAQGASAPAGPAQEQVSEAKWADGVYYAEQDQFAEKSGWKEIVALKVENGKITGVNWNGLHRDGGLDKKTTSMEGLYGLVEKGGGQAEWHEQAAKAEQFLIDTQDPAAIVLKEDGKTDAVSGVSISVGGFVELVNKALEAGPVEAGPYKDGAYHGEQDSFDAKSGWKSTVHVTVVNGKIVAASWNAVHKDGGKDKKTASKDGDYGLVEKGGAQAEWHEQAFKAEQYLLQTQDPAAITYSDEEGHTDAISGVSVHVSDFFELAQKALENAK